ncbi:DUF928 domain-containing protein [Thermosynechococcus vestitus]|uniref:DUF928 domain-containing protein n=1 Tax=Thermosynechococcus vestitus TaxID=146786 RepID=UPI0013E8BCBA|nr:DUF928 domain-containing protein [Thermosynechococcus vestitus]
MLPLRFLSLAQGTPPGVNQQSTLVAGLRGNLPNRSVPGSRFGGATRGACVTGNERLTALLPETHFGQTAVAAPTLFVFLPKSKATQGEVTTADAEQRPLAVKTRDIIYP